MNQKEGISKIIFVIPSMSGGGAERVIANLSNCMVDRGLMVEILMTAGTEIEYGLKYEVGISTLGDKTYGSVLKAWKRVLTLRKYIKDNRNAAFVGMETASNIYLLLAGIGLKSNIVVSERNDPSRFKHVKLRNIIYSILGRKFVFQTKDASDYFSYKSKKCLIIANPIKPDLPDVYTGQREKAFVAIGRLEPQKNYGLLLDAFEIVHRQRPDYALIIYGKGTMEHQLYRWIKEKSLDRFVLIKGFEAEVWQNAGKQDVYVLSSDYEGMPNALIEAMGMGMACIATDCPIGGSKELIEDRVNGLLVPVGDAKALAEAMLELACNEELKDTLRGNAVRIRDRLSIGKICDRWMEAIMW